MKLYLHHTPVLLKKMFPQLTWNLAGDQKKIFLTFDDGPEPQSTPFVLEILAKYKAKATFFTVGNCISRNTSIFREIIDGGHAIGNHTNSHVDGWKTDLPVYLDDINKCEEIIAKYTNTDTKFFRPPYGRIKISQLKEINELYKIVMWSTLSGDFDPELNLKKAHRKIRKVDGGSIIVFHDSQKHYKNLSVLLPKFMEELSYKGYEFRTLD